MVFNYIIEPNKFDILKDAFKDYNIIFKVLIVDEKTIIIRDKERPYDCQMGKRSLVLLDEFRNYGYAEKYILNTSKLTVDETIENIMKN